MNTYFILSEKLTVITKVYDSLKKQQIVLKTL